MTSICGSCNAYGPMISEMEHEELCPYWAQGRVRSFHLKNKVIVDEAIITSGTAMQRIRLIVEELGELIIALHELGNEYNLVATADALGDLLYVTLGSGVVCGLGIGVYWPSVPIGLEINELNLGQRVRIGKNLTRATSKVANYLYHDSQHDIMEHFGLGQNLNDLVVEILEAARALQIPLREVFAEIASSNMTKVLGDTSQGQKGNLIDEYKGNGYRKPDLKQFFKSRGSR